MNRINQTHKDIIRIDEELKILEPKIREKKILADSAKESNAEQDKELKIREENISMERKKNHVLNNKIQQEKRKAEIKSEKHEYELSKIWSQVDENLTPVNLSNLMKVPINNMHPALKKIAEALCFIYYMKETKDLAKSFTRDVIAATKRIKEDILEDKIPQKTMERFKQLIYKELLIKLEYQRNWKQLLTMQT